MPFLLSATLMPAARRRLHEKPVYGRCRRCLMPQRGAQGRRRAAGIRPHRRRLRDDISTVKTTYRLLRLATMPLIMQTAWPTGEAVLPSLLAQFLPDGFCAH